MAHDNIMMCDRTLSYSEASEMVQRYSEAIELRSTDFVDMVQNNGKTLNGLV